MIKISIKYSIKSGKRKNGGFTLVELLIVMMIIAVLAGLSMFSMQGARKQGRDGKRKADLEVIRSALELYKADCNLYPASLGTSITGVCPGPGSNTYLEKVPTDPGGSAYYYQRTSNYTYNLCATLEDPPVPPDSCAGGNYKRTNP